MEKSHKWIFAGSIFAFLSVLLGAFAAHGLSEKLEPRLLSVFQTGVQYQMLHSIALIFVGICCEIQVLRRPNLVGGFFLAGIFIFSGSLYILAITGTRQMGIVTPFGGLSFLIGWACFALNSLPKKS